MGLAVVLERGQAAEEPAPPAHVQRQVGLGVRPEEARHLGAQDDRGPVHALEGLAEAQEQPARVAGQRVLDRAHRAEDAPVRGGQRRAQRGAVAGGAPRLHLEIPVRLVEVDEDLDGERLAHGAPVLARPAQREEHGVGPAGVEGARPEVHGGEHGRRGRGEPRRRVADGGSGEDRGQLPPLGARQVLVQPEQLGGEVVGDEEQAGHVLRPLEVAPHPVQGVGDAREDHGSRGASTQVSLLPPPWDELTT
jgi:hypothetical protein